MNNSVCILFLMLTASHGVASGLGVFYLKPLETGIVQCSDDDSDPCELSGLTVIRTNDGSADLYAVNDKNPKGIDSSPLVKLQFSSNGIIRVGKHIKIPTGLVGEKFEALTNLPNGRLLVSTAFNHEDKATFNKIIVIAPTLVDSSYEAMVHPSNVEAATTTAYKDSRSVVVTSHVATPTFTQKGKKTEVAGRVLADTVSTTESATDSSRRSSFDESQANIQIAAADCSRCEHQNQLLVEHGISIKEIKKRILALELQLANWNKEVISKDVIKPLAPQSASVSSVRFLLNQALDAHYKRHVNYFKVEGLTLLAGGKVLFAIREVGDSFDRRIYTTIFIAGNYSDIESKFSLNSSPPFAVVADLTELVNRATGKKLGVSSVELNSDDGKLYFITTFEPGDHVKDTAFASYMWSMNTNASDLPDVTTVAMAKLIDNSSVVFEHKIEGLAFLDGKTPIIIADDDRVLTGIKDEKDQSKR